MVENTMELQMEADQYSDIIIHELSSNVNLDDSIDAALSWSQWSAN